MIYTNSYETKKTAIKIRLCSKYNLNFTQLHNVTGGCITLTKEKCVIGREMNITQDRYFIDYYKQYPYKIQQLLQYHK